MPGATPATTPLTAMSRQGAASRRPLSMTAPITDTKREITYAELQTAWRTGRRAARQGDRKGDRVIIYMPMVPEALEAMLACARLGAVHSVVFGGFAANELAVRIDDATPRPSSRPPAGSSRTRCRTTNRLLDGAIELATISLSSPLFCSATKQPLLTRRPRL